MITDQGASLLFIYKNEFSFLKEKMTTKIVVAHSSININIPYLPQLS
jgi:hypothetical protein